MKNREFYSIQDIFLRFQKIWQIAEQIPGYITKNEGFILYSLALTHSGNIIEIGPFHGKSSIIMGYGINDSNADDRQLICIDNFVKQRSSIHPESKNPKASLIQNMKDFGFFELYEQDSVEALKSLRKKSGFIFIDGDHTAERISQEFPLALDALKLGGSIAIHDYNNPAVESAYSEWITNNIVNNHETIFIKDSTPDYKGNGLIIVRP